MPTAPRLSLASASSPRFVMSVPASVTRPALGFSSPAAIISSEDLPEPDGPSSATDSPAPISSDTPRSTFTTPALPVSISCTSSSAIAGALIVWMGLALALCVLRQAQDEENLTCMAIDGRKNLLMLSLSKHARQSSNARQAFLFGAVV